MPTDATHFINGPSKREYYKRDADDIWYWWTEDRWKRQIGDKRYSCRHLEQLFNIERKL